LALLFPGTAFYSYIKRRSQEGNNIIFSVKAKSKRGANMSKKKRDLDSLENYFQNSIAQAANMGAFSFAVSPINELTQINNSGIETNDNLDENKETVKEMNEL
jgi:hypothetical protein